MVGIDESVNMKFHWVRLRNCNTKWDSEATRDMSGAREARD